MQWFYAQGGQQVGPIEEGEFRALVASHAVGADTLVWHDGMPNWQPLGTLTGYAPAPFIARVRYGGFWIRVLARVIDGFILSIPSIILVVPLVLMLGLASRPSRYPPFGLAALMMQGVLFLVTTAVGATYETYFVATRGATPGKLALGLRIVHVGGQPISVGLAFGRYLAHLLSAYLLLIGYLMVAFDAQKRGLHDRICETRVIHTR